MMRLISATFLICLVSLGPGAKAESPAYKYGGEARSRVNNVLQLKSDHLGRVDARRLLGINLGLDLLVEKSTDDVSDVDIIRGLDTLESSLFGLRFSPSEVKEVHSRINCIRNSIETAGAAVQCPSAKRIINDPFKSNSTSIGVGGLAQTNRAVGLRLTDDGREPIAIAFYGHSVDRDIGELFIRLAERDPALLQPIPIDDDFQLASCISGGTGLVTISPDSTDEAFMRMLRGSETLAETKNDTWRFTLRESAIPQMNERTGGNAPLSLAEFRVEDAQSLITSDFIARFGAEGLENDVVSALRNLWIALGDKVFVDIVSQVVGRKQIPSKKIGRLLRENDLSLQEIWTKSLQTAASRLGCKDADKIFEAYGLVYRKGDYPAARRVLEILREYAGYPAVPGVSISHTSHPFLEATPQNCTLFGPVELTAGGTRSANCNLRELSVDGLVRHEVLAGGAAIQFFATAEQIEIIQNTVYDIERTDRGGDILRWRVTSRVPVNSQEAQAFALALEDKSSLDSEFPCVLNFSRTKAFEEASELKGHVDNYRQHFYIPGEPLDPTALSYVFVFDRFAELEDSQLRQDLSTVVASLTQSYNGIKDLIEGDEGGAGAAGFPQSAILPICYALREQINTISSRRNISHGHGEFIRSLLIGHRSVLGKGVGILNPDGQFPASDFEYQLNFWPTGGDLQKVVHHIHDARSVVSSTQEENESGNPLGVSVFNLSLGRSYRDDGAAQKDRARKSLQELKDEIALWHEDGLFVVAAGQPSLTQSTVRGLKLKRISAWTADIDSTDCHFFPACLSERRNVITVGAVKPSAGAVGHKRPVLIDWSNYGSAVSVAALGAVVLGNEYGYLSGGDGENQARLKQLMTTSVRDGTSLSTVFVTALAARMAAEYPDLVASEIKKRLIATSKPYIVPGSNKEALFFGDEGELFAGAIDPQAALLDPSKLHVVWKNPPDGIPKIEEFDFFLTPSDSSLTVFNSNRERATPKLKCRWADLHRLRIEGDFRESADDPPIYEGAIACKNARRDELIEVASGPLGTLVSDQQHPCLIDGDCFIGIRGEGERITIDLDNVSDIYFPVVGR